MPLSKPKKRSTKKKTVKRSKTAINSLMNYKVSDEQRAIITANAKRYAKGNISAWSRRMALRKP